MSRGHKKTAPDREIRGLFALIARLYLISAIFWVSTPSRLWTRTK